MKIKEILEIVLGYQGNICSHSKSCGPPMAVYNAGLAIWPKGKNPKIIWYGDIDCDLTILRLLKRISVRYDTRILAMREGLRDLKSQKMVAYIKQGIKSAVWDSDYPENFAGKNYYEALEVRQASTQRMRKDRRIRLGFVTPRDTKWAWYNRWFYKGPYIVGSYIKSCYITFLSFPWSCSFAKDAYIENQTLINKIRKFISVFMKEINYQRFPSGLLHFGFLKKLQEGEDE